jgi:hypothetical protein
MFALRPSLLRALEQLKDDGFMNDKEYKTNRKEDLEEL